MNKFFKNYQIESKLVEKVLLIAESSFIDDILQSVNRIFRVTLFIQYLNTYLIMYSYTDTHYEYKDFNYSVDSLQSYLFLDKISNKTFS